MNIEEFMVQSRWNRKIALLNQQVNKASERGFAKTQVPIEVLKELLTRYTMNDRIERERT